MVRKMHAKVHKNKRITKIIIRFYLLKKLFLGDFVFIDHRLYNIDQFSPPYYIKKPTSKKWAGRHSARSMTF